MNILFLISGNKVVDYVQTKTQSAPRLLVYINGVQVDITGILFLILDSGIDREFLDALPDESRQEISAQDVRDQQIVTMTNDIRANISADFMMHYLMMKRRIKRRIKSTRQRMSS